MAQTVHSNDAGSNHAYFKRLGNMSNNHRTRHNNHSHKLRIISLSYNSSKSLSSSVKNNDAKHTPIQNMKNQMRSYFILRTRAFIPMC